ncbi:helix-turn-helix transcriptional regulator [Streptomyces sp. NBRC 109706]|uniref:helix-turn-helix transcriptional regulator n=1 Tax=Streptomyces sp. NBRC 109706 TaxID=1550035 RepID=UPI000784C18F|nr:helix-turn-helix transcriptional regulator [Streptomyces sp. NBRC 109706]
MEQGQRLGDFLRSRRARLTPADIGLRDYGGRRRVPGLRREELAQLAGVSVAYYTRLEQGLSHNASDAVLDALARVLRLDDDESAHLHRLARHPPRRRRRPRPERVRPGVRSMVESVGDLPVLVFGRGTDVLAWNRVAHALLASHLDFDAPEHPERRPNLNRLLFLDPHTRDLYADWQAKARDAVADLRLTAGRHPEDPRVMELIGELTVKSREFTALWNAHTVRVCSHHTRTYRHPVVGSLTLETEVTVLPDDDGQRLAIFHAEPGSPSHEALRLLRGVSEG